MKRIISILATTVFLAALFSGSAMATGEELVISEEQAQPAKVWGSFPEASIWAGAWINPKMDTQGLWATAKYLEWFTKYEKPENFGIGAKVRGDYGWKSMDGSDPNWSYYAPGPSVGYYRGLTLRDSIEADFSLLYRFDKNRDDGFMPDLHAEYNRILGYKNRLTLQVDAVYFEDDSWVGPGAYLHHRLNKDWKVIPGVGASLSWIDGDYISGFQPSLKFKYRNKWTIGATANLFTGNGSFFGIVAAYEFTPDINTWYETKKAR
ncbi:MAG TPA: hypothetical protein PLF30_01090 [Candidatus Moranbacteria bacterium]|mgnify:FL=1|jgi:hypothetical protein|nr:hypothetical protein [Candidatus Moranbacteria bacterium]HOF42453.1 hypothetical protein [Candidatus Moranbacteria bacterium]HPX94131.1 hypothetical protein [Candidatus Moranbacteria bacterium]HQB59191.1 hypothetical protein [Candidatus Moranbacteria bacterium]